MDFKLSKTHLLQQEMYRRFAENEVKPLAEEMDETEVLNQVNEDTIISYLEDKGFKVEKED